MDYYLSMKQILLTQISTLCQQKNENDEISNVLESNLNNLQNALEQIKSYNHNTYFKCIIKQFNCELNDSEKNTLRQLTEDDNHNDNNQYQWIFYKGFKKWYQNLYNQNDGSITNTARAETLFLGAQTEFSNHLFQNETTNNHINNDNDIYNIWQTLIGIKILNKYKSHNITKRDIMGKKSLIDVKKSIHYLENTYNKIIKSSLMRLSIVENNIFKTTIKYNKYTAHIINIYDIDIFKIVASILWTPKLASNIINICIINNNNIKQLKLNKPSNFDEAFKIQQTKRLSQHGQNKSTKIDLPDIPETPTSAANIDTDHISDNNNNNNNNNANIDVKIDKHEHEHDHQENEEENNSNSNDSKTDSRSHSNSQSISNDTNHSYEPGTELMEEAATRPSFNLEDHHDDENEFYDHHGQHESTYSNEFSIAAEMILPGYPEDTKDNEQEQTIDSDTSIHTEYTDTDNKDEQKDENNNNNNNNNNDNNNTDKDKALENNNRDTENEQSSEHDIDNYDTELEDKDNIMLSRPERLERTGTMVEYDDIENILSGDTVMNTTFDEYIKNKSKSIETDEDNIDIIPHIEMQIHHGTDESNDIQLPVMEKKDNNNNNNSHLNVNAPPLPPLKLSASSPDVMSNSKEFTTTSKAFLHGYYKNATSESERWTRLKTRINRHWDEDVTAKMRIFCEENYYEFEDILDDIADTLVSIDSSNIISHLKDELFWNDAKTLRFYRTLRRILISRQSTQFISQFNGAEIHNLSNENNQDIVKIIDLKGHSGNINNINSKSLPFTAAIDSPSHHHNIMHQPPYIRRTSHELQMEKAWWAIKKSLLNNKWGHSCFEQFKNLCFEDDFHSIALIIDDIGCFDNGDSLLMPALAQRLKWDNKKLLKFVNDLRIALTDDMNRLARDSQAVKRVEIPTIEFQRTDSVSISGSTNPIIGVNGKGDGIDTVNINKHEIFGIELEVPTPIDQHNITSKEFNSKIEKDRIDKLRKYEQEQTPPLLSRTSTPATVASDRSLHSLKDRMIDVSDHESLLNLWKEEYININNNDKRTMFEESSSKCKCQFIDECIVYKRIMFIMEFYMSWIVIDQTDNNVNINNMINVSVSNEEMYHQISIYTFICKLYNYTYIQLWNDYFHIRTYHTINNPNWNNNTDICIAETCRILGRYHRNRTLCKDNETRLEMYNIRESNQTMEVITQQLCDIIHCLLFHPIALNTNNYKKLTVQSSVDTDIYEDDDEPQQQQQQQKQKQQNDNDIKEGELLGIGVKIVDSKIYCKLREDRIKYHKFLTIDDRLAYNHIEQKTCSVQTGDSKLKRSIVNKNKPNIKKSHSTSFRTLPGLNNASSEWEVFLSLNMKNLEQYSKYNEFHDELLNNDIENISEEQWNDTWKRAELFKKTFKGKEMVSKKNKPGLRMRKNDPIPTHYIMALMIWCNFDTLLNSFRKHCIEIQIGDTEKQFQFSRWGFWLNACIECYGQNIEQNEEFYCCINGEIMLNEMWLKFTYPTSITTSYLITQIYSNNKFNKNGVIFVLNKRINDSNLRPYINCQWVSDYGYEECEKLIFNGSMDVKSVDLIKYYSDNHINNHNYYQPHIFTIKWWDIMTNVSKYKYFHNGLGEDKEKILLQLLINIGSIKKNQKNEINNLNIIIPKYVQYLFKNLCNRNFLNINLKLLDDLLLSSQLKQRFIDNKDGRIDFWRLILLFPNATKFIIRLQKGLELDSFICEKFLKTIDRWNKINKNKNNDKKINLNLNCVVLSADRQNRNLKEQTKNLLKQFQSRNWMIFFTKSGNKMKFEKNTNFIKRN